MNAIIKRALRDRRLSIIAFCAAGILLFVMYGALFPSIKQQAAALQQAYKNLPNGLNKAFGIGESVYTDFANFLGVEMFSITWPILALFLVIGGAGSSLAGETEKGTLGLLLSAPISRNKIYWSKYLAGLIAFGIFAAILLLVYPIGAAIGESVNAGIWNKLVVLAVLFGWSAFALTMLFSSLLNERGKVYGLTAGLFMLMYVANIVASLKDSLSLLKYTSFFHYFNYAEILKGANIGWSSMVVFGLTIVVCSLLGWQIFNRKDLAI